MVREAYALLRQSIIHVEQDDISFEDEDDHPNGVANGHDPTQDEDESMDAADIAALDAAESSYNAAATSSSRAPNGHASTPVPEKRKMRITCECPVMTFHDSSMGLTADNRYMEIMNLCVLHLSDVERDTGSGVDREELIQWYLEQKEQEFETPEDMEYERELIGKALVKLAKVCYGLVSSHLISSHSTAACHRLKMHQEPRLTYRTITSLRSEETYGKVWHLRASRSQWMQVEMMRRCIMLSVSDCQT